jgi:hypothetical protein
VSGVTAERAAAAYAAYAGLTQRRLTEILRESKKDTYISLTKETTT